MNSKVYKSYEISKNEYLELKYFCLRYWEKKKVVDQANLDGYTSCGDYARRCLKDVTLIEHALELSADNEIVRAYLRRSVTENVKFENLDVPMGRNQFYKLRKKFFCILRELKMGTN